MRAHLRTYGQLARAGFRRQSTYRLAMLAGVVTNVVFGFIRSAIMFAALDSAGGTLAGYTRDTISAYVWLSQGLIGAVNIGASGSTELSDRIRNGDVAVDFTRPVDVQGAYLATDLGRATFTFLPRGIPTVLVGALTVGLALPSDTPSLPARSGQCRARSHHLLPDRVCRQHPRLLAGGDPRRPLPPHGHKLVPGRVVRAGRSVPWLALHPRPRDAVPLDPPGAHRHHLRSCGRHRGRRDRWGAMPLGLPLPVSPDAG